MTNFNIILLNNYETLDVFGPVEIIGKMPKAYSLKYYSQDGGIVESSQFVRTVTLPFSEIEQEGILLIPGGMGTRQLVIDDKFIEHIKVFAQRAQYVLTVCTGAALLAKTGLLDGKKATSNKMAFDWVCETNKEVEWVKKARWVKDEKFYTSSGVSAGMDMTLGYINDVHGEKAAHDICKFIEYNWHGDKDNDPFAVE